MKNKVKLGDLVNIKTGKLDANAAVANGKYPFFTTSEETFKIDTYAYDDEAVLVAGNGNLNVKYFHGKFNAYQRTYILTKKENINVNIKYIYYFLDKYLGTLRSLSIGGVIKYIKLENLINPILKLPTIEFQNKIVKKLDTLKEILDISRKKLNMLSDFNKSLFTTMFGDIKTNDKNWKIKKLKELVEIKSYIFNENLDTIWLLNLEDIEPNTGKLIRKKKIYFKNTPSSVISFDENYILYSKLRPYLNKVFLPDEKGFGTSELIPLFPKTSINKIFLAEYLRNDKIVDFLSQKVSGAKMPRVIMKEFQDLILILPPIELQNKFAERIEKIEKLSFEIEEAIKEAENLYTSLISKYFD